MVRGNNKGSATLEAALVMPLFIFAILVLFHGIRLRMTEAIIYEAASETVEYMAELSYLEECNYLVPKMRIGEYVDNKGLVESYIADGLDGISFLGSEYLDEDGYVSLRVSYQVEINVPFIGDLSGERSYIIRQKAYKGIGNDQVEGQLSDSDVYVYITDNREAYHTTRACTHLDLSITPMAINKAKEKGYTLCEFCQDVGGNSVLVTSYGNRYHTTTDCSGLRRTVYRVKKSQVEELGECMRCGN